eukprot:15379518-Alexandrium_andersonii.AAC.1
MILYTHVREVAPPALRTSAVVPQLSEALEQKRFNRRLHLHCRTGLHDHLHRDRFFTRAVHKGTRWAGR